MAYLPELFERAAKSNASNIAVVEETNRWTFAQLSDEVDRIATNLKERVKGDVVGVLIAGADGLHLRPDLGLPGDPDQLDPDSRLG